MPIQIGAPPESDFHEPLRLLSDCHRRIERFLNQLLVVTEQACGGELDSMQRDALEIALRYFAKAAPMHTCDEEESLFPQLRACQNAEIERALTALQALESDHRVVEETHTEIDWLARLWLAQGSLGPDETGRLLHLLRALRNTYRRHIAVEDHEIFPLADRLLDESAITALGRAMAARRGLDYDNLPPITRCAQRRMGGQNGMKAEK